MLDFLYCEHLSGWERCYINKTFIITIITNCSTVLHHVVLVFTIKLHIACSLKKNHFFVLVYNYYFMKQYYWREILRSSTLVNIQFFSSPPLSFFLIIIIKKKRYCYRISLCTRTTAKKLTLTWDTSHGVAGRHHTPAHFSDGCIRMPHTPASSDSPLVLYKTHRRYPRCHWFYRWTKRQATWEPVRENQIFSDAVQHSWGLNRPSVLL